MGRIPSKARVQAPFGGGGLHHLLHRADFAREYPHGVYVLGCSGHVLAVIDGKWWDSWDSGAECPIYYWYKEENNADL